MSEALHWNAQDDPKEVLTRIAQCATLLAVLRTPIPKDASMTPQPESPLRANAVLYNLARGHALVHGRTHLSVEDLPMVARVAISSMPQEPRKVLLALARNEGQPLTVKQVENSRVGSRHTAERVMQALDQLGVMKYEKQGTGKASRLSIRPEWAWCMAQDFRALLLEGQPGKNRGMRLNNEPLTWQKLGGECQLGILSPSSNPDREKVEKKKSRHTPPKKMPGLESMGECSTWTVGVQNRFLHS